MRMVLRVQGDWNAAASSLLAALDADRVNAFASGSEYARQAAANPRLDALIQLEHDALAAMLVHGQHLPAWEPSSYCSSACTSSSRRRRDLSHKLALGGFPAIVALNGQICDGLAQVPTAVLRNVRTPEMERQRTSAAQLFGTDGMLLAEHAAISGTPDVGLARRAALGLIPMGESPGSLRSGKDTVVSGKRDAILACSILHMRDVMERSTAAPPSVRHGSAVAVPITSNTS